MKLLLLLSVSCLAFGADSKPLPWEKTRLRSGQALYRTSCATCHDIDKTQADTKKIGPSLNQVFKTGKFPISGDPLNRATLKDKIKQGGVIMPGFDSLLNDREIDLLIDYVATK